MGLAYWPKFVTQFTKISRNLLSKHGQSKRRRIHACCARGWTTKKITFCAIIFAMLPNKWNVMRVQLDQTFFRLLLRLNVCHSVWMCVKLSLALDSWVGNQRETTRQKCPLKCQLDSWTAALDNVLPQYNNDISTICHLVMHRHRGHHTVWVSTRKTGIVAGESIQIPRFLVPWEFRINSNRISLRAHSTDKTHVLALGHSFAFNSSLLCGKRVVAMVLLVAKFMSIVYAVHRVV